MKKQITKPEVKKIDLNLSDVIVTSQPVQPGISLQSMENEEETWE